MDKNRTDKKIDWEELYKVRIANSDDSFQHHEVVKLLLVMKILKKYKRKYWIRIYTEFQLEGLKPDIYFENLKTKEILCYEIQKDFSPQWLKEKTEKYNNYGVPFFKLDFIPINLNELSTDIKKLNKQLDKFIF